MRDIKLDRLADPIPIRIPPLVSRDRNAGFDVGRRRAVRLDDVFLGTRCVARVVDALEFSSSPGLGYDGVHLHGARFHLVMRVAAYVGLSTPAVGGRLVRASVGGEDQARGEDVDAGTAVSW